jgi:outer membrane protein TolC
MLKRAWLIAVGGALLAGWAAAAPVPEKKKDSPEITKLLKERRDVLRNAVEARTQEFEAGRGTLGVLLHVSRELLNAELELATTPEKRFDAYAGHFNALRKIETITKEGYDAGRVKVADYFEIRAARLEAEIQMRRAEAELKPKK